VGEVPIQGRCDDRFGAVRAAFEANFTDRGDIGAGLCVYVGNEPVVDLWGGWSDAARSDPWREATLVNVWSSTKGAVAVAAQQLIDRGLLDVDAPVAEYWPEFAAAGKATTPVRWLLSHRAGLSGPRQTVTHEDLFDWDLMTGLLAVQEPWWEPGTVSGYHAMTFGYLVGEVIRRVSGVTPGQFVEENLSAPLGLDLHIGLSDDQIARSAELVMEPLPADSPMHAAFAQLSEPARAALLNPDMQPPTAIEVANSAAWRQAEIPAANGHATAKALATLYAALANGGELGGTRIVTAEAVERLREGQGPCVDVVLGAAAPIEWEWGQGVALNRLGLLGPNPRAFAHSGYGGSFGMADPEGGVAIGWVMNHMDSNLMGDPRTMALIAAVYESL
jgi:CubicO group peptidase (beta-lactamase class C family)